jgi:hypothetical protein
MHTILCSKQEPSDIEVVGTGKLIFHGACKAYGTRVLIQAKTIMTTNNTEDIIPPLSLDYDCCIFEKDATIRNNPIGLTIEKHSKSFGRFTTSQPQSRRGGQTYFSTGMEN